MGEAIPHSLSKLSMAGCIHAFTCLDCGLLLVPVRLFLGFRTGSIAWPLRGLPDGAMIGVAWGYSRSAHVRFRVLLALALRLVIDRLGKVLIRGCELGHLRLTGWAGNARGKGTVRMGLPKHTAGTDPAQAKEGV